MSMCPFPFPSPALGFLILFTPSLFTRLFFFRFSSCVVLEIGIEGMLKREGKKRIYPLCGLLSYISSDCGFPKGPRRLLTMGHFPFLVPLRTGNRSP